MWHSFSPFIPSGSPYFPLDPLKKKEKKKKSLHQLSLYLFFCFVFSSKPLTKAHTCTRCGRRLKNNYFFFNLLTNMHPHVYFYIIFINHLPRLFKSITLEIIHNFPTVYLFLFIKHWCVQKGFDVWCLMQWKQPKDSHFRLTVSKTIAPYVLYFLNPDPQHKIK